MILFDFEYERPNTLEEAVAILDQAGDDARLLAGGTDLLPNMRVEIATPALLVSLGGIEPQPPESLADGTIRLDALSRLADLERSNLVQDAHPMLAESIRAVGSNQTREMGTLGGNLCQELRCLYLNQKHDYQFAAPCYKRGGDCCYPFPNNASDICWAVYTSDIAPALIALGAEIEVLSSTGVRRVGADALFTGDGMTPLSLGPAEIVRAVVVPPARSRSGWGYHKSTVRGGLEYAMAIMAVVLEADEDRKTCTDARVILGAVRQGPVRSQAAEEALAGAPLNTATIAKAAKDASRAVRPFPHHGYSVMHMIETIRVYLQRTLGAAAERAGGGRDP